jgi:uncharacterized membrane-anchored protein YjiN (DUF445 family)
VVLNIILYSGNYFRFDSVFIKKSNQTKIKKKNRNRFKPTSFGFVRFDFLEQNPVQTSLTRFFWFGAILTRFCSVFSSLARFFPIWV